jgi:hypothetical protein
VDGFDQDECTRQCDERTVIPCCLLATQRNALKSFELSDYLFDTGAALVENFRKEGGHVFDVGSIRDCRAYSALACGLAVRFGIVALVAERCPRIDIGADVEKRLEVATVAGLTTSEMKCDGQAAAKSVFK